MLHVTPLLLVSLVSFAVTGTLPPWLIVCGATGVRAIVIEDVCTAIPTVAITVGLATEVAVIVTVVVLETVVGAVYVTEVEVWLLRVPKPLGEMLQLTPLLLESFATTAVTVVDWAGFREVAPADKVIVIGTPTGVLLPPPHATRKANPATNTIAENARTLPPLPYVIGTDSLRQL